MVDRSHLTLEQRFSLASFQTQVDKMSLEQAKELLMEAYEQLLLKDYLCKEIVKDSWGLNDRTGGLG
jgi:uncharacterized protein YdeI (BOF family)